MRRNGALRRRLRSPHGVARWHDDADAITPDIDAVHRDATDAHREYTLRRAAAEAWPWKADGHDHAECIDMIAARRVARVPLRVGFTACAAALPAVRDARRRRDRSRAHRASATVPAAARRRGVAAGAVPCRSRVVRRRLLRAVCHVHFLDSVRPGQRSACLRRLRPALTAGNRRGDLSFRVGRTAAGPGATPPTSTRKTTKSSATGRIRFPRAPNADPHPAAIPSRNCRSRRPGASTSR